MIASMVGNPVWGIVAAAVFIVAMLVTYAVLIYEPKALTPGPGHPAYEGDEDEDD